MNHLCGIDKTPEATGPDPEMSESRVNLFTLAQSVRQPHPFRRVLPEAKIRPKYRYYLKFPNLAVPVSTEEKERL